MEDAQKPPFPRFSQLDMVLCVSSMYVIIQYIPLYTFSTNMYILL